jgi:peptidoglycan/LPS O-acetylase OafA/YrhL
LAVDIFFILSGVVLQNAYEEKLLQNTYKLEFLLTRLIRIYPLYLISIIIATLNVFYAQKSTLIDSTYHVVFSLFLLPNPGRSLEGYFSLNGPAWTLLLEIYVNIFYAFIAPILTNKLILLIMLISVTLLVTLSMLSGASNLDLGYTVSSLPIGFCRVAYSFFGGVLIARIYDAHRKVEFSKILQRLGPWIILAAVTAILASYPRELNVLFDIFSITICFPILVYVSLFTKPTLYTSKILLFIGTISYAIYVLHVPISLFIYNILRKNGIFVEEWGPSAGFLLLAFLIALSASLDKVYDRPLRRLLFDAIKRGRKSFHDPKTSRL